MLTTKNLGALRLWVLAPLALFFWGGCTPPGARALLDGDRLIREGRYAQAIEKLKVAAQLLPEESQARAWNHLGLAYHGAGQPNEAVAAYRQAQQRNPNLAAVRYNLGCLFLEQNKLPEAISEFTTYTVLERSVAPGWLKLATAQTRARQWDAAEKSFLNTLQLNAASPEALNGLAVVQLQKKKLREAGHYLSLALQRQPDYGPALLNLAVLYHQHLRDRPQALQKYRAYLSLKPVPAHATEVQEIVRQLDLELNPPPRVVLTNPPSPVRPVVQIPSPATNPVLAHVTTSAPPVTRPVVQTNQTKFIPAITESKTQAPPLLAKADLPAPSKVQSPPQSPSVPAANQVTKAVTKAPKEVPNPSETEPPAKTEVIQLKDEPPPKPAQDVTPPSPMPVADASLPTTNQLPATNATSVKPYTGPLIQPPPEEKRGFVQRLNPLTWFRGRTKQASPTTSAEKKAVEIHAPTSPPKNVSENVPSPGPTPPITEPKRVQIPRYVYQTPARPAAGDRSQAERTFSEGLKAHQERRLTAAIEAYRNAIRLDPSYFEAQYNLGLAAYETQDLAVSLAAYERALAVDPKSGDARYNFSLALQRAGYWLDAVDELDKLLVSHPEDAKVHFSLGKLYAERLARTDLAKVHYRKVLDLQPLHPQASAIRYWLAAHP